MINRHLGNVGGLTVVATLAACLLAGCAYDQPGHVSCSNSEEQRVTVLAQLPILDVRPPSTEAAGAYSGCGVDDSGDAVASRAGQRYRSKLAEPEIRSFYWDELMREGWRNASTAIPQEVAPSLAFQRGISCLVKNISGTRAAFTISFDPPPSTSPSPAPVTYAIQATDQDAEYLESPCWPSA
ncbi:hypothetical protein Adi01nite_34960 [Amorphoplanes digitatis]|uniref:Lipoprotein n=1 Tax=Actinoplanes digitatis TaxID=1868 RepID=A0A7W7I0W3_9ACTN|nr:hypothetical protein [Actinoplanes digitatis]MBB4764429.1 hypothetical protein [Actinoplanes digitatis]GID94084.1 hypothetical protein Adi01nite_34960 [Actinoplanes digitatis]